MKSVVGDQPIEERAIDPARLPRGDSVGDGGVPTPRGRPWQKGQSGNPAGRRISAEANKRLEDPITVKSIIDALLARVKEGDTRAIELLWERHEGKLTQKTENETRQTIVVEQGMEETPP